jgi:hypothetical protein
MEPLSSPDRDASSAEAFNPYSLAGIMVNSHPSLWGLKTFIQRRVLENLENSGRGKVGKSSLTVIHNR